MVNWLFARPVGGIGWKPALYTGLAQIPRKMDENLILSMVGFVDQCEATLNDPEVPEDEKVELRRQLHKLYIILQELKQYGTN